MLVNAERWHVLASCKTNNLILHLLYHHRSRFRMIRVLTMRRVPLRSIFRDLHQIMSVLLPLKKW